MGVLIGLFPLLLLWPASSQWNQGLSDQDRARGSQWVRRPSDSPGKGTGPPSKQGQTRSCAHPAGPGNARAYLSGQPERFAHAHFPRILQSLEEPKRADHVNRPL